MPRTTAEVGLPALSTALGGLLAVLGGLASWAGSDFFDDVAIASAFFSAVLILNGVSGLWRATWRSTKSAAPESDATMADSKSSAAPESTPLSQPATTVSAGLQEPLSENIGATPGETVTEQAGSALVAALRDREPAVRAVAALVLGHIGEARAVPPLTEVLGDPSPEVRSAAIRALGQLRDARMTPALVAALQDDNARVRKAAAWALGDLHSPLVGEGSFSSALRSTLGRRGPRLHSSAADAFVDALFEADVRPVLRRTWHRLDPVAQAAVAARAGTTHSALSAMLATPEALSRAPARAVFDLAVILGMPDAITAWSPGGGLTETEQRAFITAVLDHQWPAESVLGLLTTAVAHRRFGATSTRFETTADWIRLKREVFDES